MLAGDVAASRDTNDKRCYLLGALAIRADGTTVSSQNGSNLVKDQRCHAEARVLRKAGFHAVIYVVRVSRRDGSLRCAKPCKACRAELKNKRVKRVYYSISDSEYGVMEF